MPYATNATIDLSRMRRLTNTDAVWYVEPVINHQSWFDPPITKAHTYSSGFVSCILHKWPRAWECQRFYFCIRCMTYGWLPPLASWQTDTGVEVTGCIFVQNPFWSTIYEHSTVWVVFGEAKELFFRDDMGRSEYYCKNEGGPAMTQPTMWGCRSKSFWWVSPKKKQ